MTRPKKSLPPDKLTVDQLKELAVHFVQQRIAETCTRTRAQTQTPTRLGARDQPRLRNNSCDCANNLPGIFVDAIKSLPAAFVERSASPARLKSLSDIDEFCDWLSQVYEHLLLYIVEGNESGAESACTLRLCEKSKKRLGSFYTPRDLAVFTVEKALHELVYEGGKLKSPDQILSLRVVDASMGCGMFLTAALSYLSERLSEARNLDSRYTEAVGTFELLACRQDVLRSCLYGVDLDPAAVQVAQFLLMVQCGAVEIGGSAAGTAGGAGYACDLHESLTRKLKFGNSLVGMPISACMDEKVCSLERADAFCNEILGNDSASFDYFHWSLEFSDVFQSKNPGFDAVLGNPPWEILKPNSREFFQRKDAQYWTRGKQEALRKQDELREESQIDDEWNDYRNDYKLLSQWVSKSGAFRLQGSADINSYKLFVELSLMIAKLGGVVSLIVPSSLYSDKGSSDLRHALLRRNKWRFLRSFHNAEGLFDIHRSFKFCIFLVEKGGSTDRLKANFDIRSVSEAHDVSPFDVAQHQLEKFSPNWFSIPEIESARDILMVEKIAKNCVRFEEFASIFKLKFRREFDMTNDSFLFMLRDEAEGIGYRADMHGRWILGEWKSSKSRIQTEQETRANVVASADGAYQICRDDVRDVALPLYEGRMLGQFDVSQKGWVHGKGRQALWLPVPDGRIMPQYLISEQKIDTNGSALKVGFLGVGSATNARTMIAACLGAYPCGNSVPTFQCNDPKAILLLTACLNSFVYDYLLRMRLAGNNLNYFIVQESFLPRPESLLSEPVVLDIAARLSYNPRHFAPELQPFLRGDMLQSELTTSERMQLRCILDAIIADLYGLDLDDLQHILRDCDGDRPGKQRAKPKSDEQRVSARGFWRVDKNQPAEHRQTVLTLLIFEQLKKSGRKRFLEDNDFAGSKLASETSLHF